MYGRDWHNINTLKYVSLNINEINNKTSIAQTFQNMSNSINDVAMIKKCFLV